MAWTITFHPAAKAEFEAQPDDIRAKLERLAEVIVEHGLKKLPRKSTKHLQDKLWELRMEGRDGIARALYVTLSGEQFVIVRVFTKKSQKTPPREIDLAFDRIEELK